ncbi:class I SAM-dependent methyltransferase [Acaryochloris sp. 'Moss Beach']|uniref:class I SAM-dependent methyltransferase n=1 Tax=Acaryochloris sp. 'Moss Beach' TaxID=2740837 RepID=UPI001F34F6D4|nr:class I SAM-dependent methyltransferase [Acaryochloris sp. 'Moss Beach']UJB69469.1 class I SAM-dependent methyltransferase [Acaryochloris sp. 'Moss Beach']
MPKSKSQLKRLLEVDTVSFEAHSSEHYKHETQGHWSEDPCGSNYSDKDVFSKSYFNEIERHRYSTHPWLKKDIDSLDLESKKVLEIGYGMGTDHLSMARKGGVMYGIDLTPKNYEATSLRLEINNLESKLLTGDAEILPYEDGEFDFVYSFGVIHHSPNTSTIISEIFRVLKPGGKCYITVYHKNSVFFWWTTYFYKFLICRGYETRSLQEQLSLIEYPNDNENIVVKLYSRKEFESLFADFSSTFSYVRHLLPIDIAFLSGFWRNPTLPKKILNFLGNWFGWYVVVQAEK